MEWFSCDLKDLRSHSTLTNEKKTANKEFAIDVMMKNKNIIYKLLIRYFKPLNEIMCTFSLELKFFKVWSIRRRRSLPYLRKDVQCISFN